MVEYPGYFARHLFRRFRKILLGDSYPRFDAFRGDHVILTGVWGEAQVVEPSLLTSCVCDPEYKEDGGEADDDEGINTGKIGGYRTTVGVHAEIASTKGHLSEPRNWRSIGFRSR